jgi:5-methylcytosine-specific restriction endonuclease McrA
MEKCVGVCLSMKFIRREKDIKRLAGQGYSPKTIAWMLNLPAERVEFYFSTEWEQERSRIELARKEKIEREQLQRQKREERERKAEIRRVEKEQVLRLEKEADDSKIVGCESVKVIRSEALRKRQKDYHARRKMRPNHDLEGKIKRFTKDSLEVITPEQVIQKFGPNPICYLTGKRVNYQDGKTYHLDHRVARSRGGKSDLDNMEIACPLVNQAKSSMSLEDFIELCELVAANRAKSSDESESSQNIHGAG